MNKYFDFSRSPEGDCSFRRLESRPPCGDLIVPRADLEATNYIDPAKLGHLLVAGRNYVQEGHCVLPPATADLATLLVKVITASELAVDHRETVSKAGQTGAIARWGNRTDAELEPIALPEVIIPMGLTLPPIPSGGVDIPPEEYLKTKVIFLIRGYEPGQYLTFYNYYGRNHWLDGTVDTPADRLNRALRWAQLNGPRRFDADPAAHVLFLELLNALPAKKRVYLLGDGVQVTIDSAGHVCLHARKEIQKEIKDLPKAKAALDAYRKAHHLANDRWGFNPIPFSIKRSRR